MYTLARPRAWRNTAETSIPREKKKHITRRGSNIDACRDQTQGRNATPHFLLLAQYLSFCYTRVLRFLVLRKDEEKVEIQTTQTIPTNK